MNITKVEQKLKATEESILELESKIQDFVKELGRNGHRKKGIVLRFNSQLNILKKQLGMATIKKTKPFKIGGGEKLPENDPKQQPEKIDLSENVVVASNAETPEALAEAKQVENGD